MKDCIFLDPDGEDGVAVMEEENSRTFGALKRVNYGIFISHIGYM